MDDKTSEEYPDILRERGKKFQALVTKRAQAGNPFPPGGIFYYGRGVMIELTREEMEFYICDALQVPPHLVNVNLQFVKDEGFKFEVNVGMPQGWMNKGVSGPVNKQELEIMMRKTIDAVVGKAKDDFEKKVTLRLRVFPHGQEN